MDYSAIIKEIGRGKQGARSIALDSARALFGAMLDGEVPELQLGALLIGFRVKGESCDELRGFVAAAEERLARLPVPPAGPMPVVIPTYNGARLAPNLVPLLALGLRERGVPVLVHGVERDPRRVTTAEVFQALGVAACADVPEAAARLRSDGLAFAPIGVLCPGLAQLLEIRWRLGLRNSGHTVCKMIQPLAGEALQMVSVTHPDYLRSMREYFAAYPAQVLLMRGTEGEAVASVRRPQAIEWLHAGTAEIVVPAVEGPVSLPALPAALQPEPTARWIQNALADGAIPGPIAAQIDAIAALSRREGVYAGRTPEA
jgi:anthranilate phosphoribosyltransferase